MKEVFTNPEVDLMIDFHDAVSQIRTVDDMFPPDDGATASLVPRPRLPELSGALELAPVFDMDAVRARRQRIMGQSAVVLQKIEAVLCEA